MARGGSLYRIHCVVADNRCCAPFLLGASGGEMSKETREFKKLEAEFADYLFGDEVEEGIKYF